MTAVRSAAGTIFPGAIAGALVLPRLLRNGGMLIGQEGVDYYAEIHTSPFNAIVHTIGMPLVAYGALTAVPCLWRGSVQSYRKAQDIIYVAYMAHYMTIDLNVGVAAAVVYYTPLELARQTTSRTFSHLCCSNDLIATGNAAEYDFARLNCACYGGLVMLSALVVQEIVGHSMGGDEPSRPEGVCNAILYAIYFSISHLFT